MRNILYLRGFWRPSVLEASLKKVLDKFFSIFLRACAKLQIMPIEMTFEEREKERREYERRDDLREEKGFWKDAFFSALGNDRELSAANLDACLKIADDALEAFRRRF